MDEAPEWACPECGGYGIVGNGGAGGIFLDWACPTCDGEGVRPGITPPWTEKEAPRDE